MRHKLCNNEMTHLVEKPQWSQGHVRIQVTILRFLTLHGLVFTIRPKGIGLKKQMMIIIDIII